MENYEKEIQTPPAASQPPIQANEKKQDPEPLKKVEELEILDI